MQAWYVVERGLAIAYFICGVSLIFSPQLWKAFLDDFAKERTAFFLGFLTLFLGAFMVASHNIWEVSPRLITTLIAWGALIKGGVLLTRPDWLTGLMRKISLNENLIRLDGVLAIGLAATIFYFT